MTFTAELTNPTPPGLIDTKGHFGPWDFDEAVGNEGRRALRFPTCRSVRVQRHLGHPVFGGRLHRGAENIVVDGTTDVPNFQLDRGGRGSSSHDAIPCHRRWHQWQYVPAAGERPISFNTDMSPMARLRARRGRRARRSSSMSTCRRPMFRTCWRWQPSQMTPVLTASVALEGEAGDLHPARMPVLQKMSSRGQVQFHRCPLHSGQDQGRRCRSEPARAR